MKIIYRTGSLLDASENFIVHGCNAQGVMGAGVAALIRGRYPEAYKKYRKEYERNNFLKLGDVIVVETDQHVVLNAITQEFYGRDPNRVYVSYDAVRKAINLINQMFVTDDDDDEPVERPMTGFFETLTDDQRERMKSRIGEAEENLGSRYLPVLGLAKKLNGVAFPLIGAGLANGKWSIISEIIEEEATNFQPVVYLLDGKIPV